MGTESEIDMLTLERLRKLGGDELLTSMVLLFISHADSAIRSAADGVAAGDFEALRKAAHSLKSSAGNVGARRLQGLADQMEGMAERKSGEFGCLMADLEDAYKKAKDILGNKIRERRQT